MRREPYRPVALNNCLYMFLGQVGMQAFARVAGEGVEERLLAAVSSGQRMARHSARIAVPTSLPEAVASSSVRFQRS